MEILGGMISFLIGLGTGWFAWGRPLKLFRRDVHRRARHIQKLIEEAEARR
jgi:hypothetical protein